MSNTPFRLYKHYIHEGGIATPLIAYWPEGIQQLARITDQMGHIVDIMPTFLEVAGATYPKMYKGEGITPMEGQSLVPVLRGETIERGPIGWEHEGNAGYRDGKWKLVKRKGKEAEWELYDMERDRTEQYNLANKHPDITKSMIEKYLEWANRIGV